MTKPRKAALPVACGVRGPRLNNTKTRAEYRREWDDATNQRIAAAWAPDFPDQERFGDDR